MLHCSNKQSQSSVSYNNITISTHGAFTFHGHKGCLVSAAPQGSYCTPDSNASQADFVPSPLRWKLSICFSAPAKVSHTVPPITFHWAESYVVLTNASICKVYCHLYSTRRNKKLFRKISQVTERRGLCVWGI